MGVKPFREAFTSCLLCRASPNPKSKIKIQKFLSKLRYGQPPWGRVSSGDSRQKGSKSKGWTFMLIRGLKLRASKTAVLLAWTGCIPFLGQADDTLVVFGLTNQALNGATLVTGESLRGLRVE